MPFHYKAFVIVMVLTMVSFLVAKPVFVHFMSAEDFARRRNTWLALTTAAFLLPNFWLFALVAVLLLAYAARRDSNPAALYLFLLLALPPISRTISIPGAINALLTVDHLRLLTLAVLVPVAVRLLRAPTPLTADGFAAARASRWALPDVLLLSYLALQLVLAFPVQSITASARLAVDLFVFTALPYFVISRTLDTHERVVEAMAAFTLGMALLVPLGVVEFVKGWLLYQGLEGRWEGEHIFSYLMRGSFLRAQVSAGHSLVFGFALAVAFGMWLYLQTRLQARAWRWLGVVTFVTGLIVTLARGSWLGAALVLIAFSLVGPNALRRFLKTAAVVGLICAAVLATPYGQKIIDILPFVGTHDEASITYREKIVEASWQIIKVNPFFGSFSYMQYMGSLRQGEGIIDIVNTYAGVALTYGLVGTVLYVGFYLSIAWGCYKAIRQESSIDPDLSLVGTSLLACLLGTLLMIATVGQYLSVPSVQMGVAGLASAFVAIARRRFETSDLARPAKHGSRLAARFEHDQVVTAASAGGDIRAE